MSVTDTAPYFGMSCVLPADIPKSCFNLSTHHKVIRTKLHAWQQLWQPPPATRRTYLQRVDHGSCGFVSVPDTAPYSVLATSTSGGLDSIAAYISTA
jgi:hypothetical protein